ncbi:MULTISPECIES: hypothetical protein [Streptomyces]|uniref:Uncharacterized protein n=2 Tax=Streptomyces rimosus subsp. rimosus TaxID=132474 RepID=L8F0H8_STRR1|nr:MULTISPECIES: hypothetical protein [Streptomyces]KOG74969.1 hypothetical protein ADK78_13420 [Kitasatospora aureofaciens]MYT41831.1 hypothetical protein [Streptomyces sp. SID5471]KOT41771.1 hypothetical protein ADK84_10450 [Streptomyces sp. NRRL WC-3701]KOT43929.1 hypothetical protein ADK42_06240 [Streptomyces rimosus subsp. rimosus]KOT67265.1 hypothetical protein ADK44_03620 [Streptomyces rimosus subsp. rimosus]
MKTCPRFATLREEYEREIGFLTAHSARHAGRPAAKSSAKHAASAKARMARALSGHVGRCPECG